MTSTIEEEAPTEQSESESKGGSEWRMGYFDDFDGCEEW